MKKEIYNLEVCENGHVINAVPTGVFEDTLICPSCKKEEWIDSNFCGWCGTRLRANKYDSI